jgi:hypothetical protein
MGGSPKSEYSPALVADHEALKAERVLLVHFSEQLVVLLLKVYGQLREEVFAATPDTGCTQVGASEEKVIVRCHSSIRPRLSVPRSARNLI